MISAVFYYYVLMIRIASVMVYYIRCGGNDSLHEGSICDESRSHKCILSNKVWKLLMWQECKDCISEPMVTAKNSSLNRFSQCTTKTNEISTPGILNLRWCYLSTLIIFFVWCPFFAYLKQTKKGPLYRWQPLSSTRPS